MISQNLCSALCRPPLCLTFQSRGVRGFQFRTINDVMYESGTAVRFVSGQQARKKLQLNLKDFRRLCILKGIYPREPKNKRKASKGGTTLHTYYALKDVQFLLHEPVINKFRDHKHFVKKLRKALHRDDADKAERVRGEEPEYSIDHIVKERYPSFTDALRDMDDALCLIFIFARLPKAFHIKSELIHTCRRLAVEFMHYVISARCLRKVFVSIKGVYYQAEINGETVTWLVQHERGHQPLSDIDFNVMITFAQFYSVFLGFVNFRLYSSLGLHYPPMLDMPSSSNDDVDEIIASLGTALSGKPTSKEEADVEIDEFDTDSSPELMKKAKEEAEMVKKQQRLFDGLKFFLNREVPRESLAFVIRSCGGDVSWSPESGYGSTFAEDDPSITHHIVDRPTVPDQRLNRWYVQPQWIFDCVNARSLIPREPYYPGALLPPHLSPFAPDEDGEEVEEDWDSDNEGASTSINAEMMNDEKQNPVADEKEEPTQKLSKTQRRKLAAKQQQAKEIAVQPGKRISEHPQKVTDKVGENRKLQELMLSKKKRKTYENMKKAEKQAKTKKETLKRKRKMLNRDAKRAK